MYSRYLLCYTCCLGACLAAVVRAFPSVLLNASVVSTQSGNRTLGAWPPRTPWIMDIPGSRDLSITVTWYGSFAQEAGRDSIRGALKDFERRFANDGEHWLVPEPHHTVIHMNSGIATLGMNINTLPPHLPPPREFARVLKTIYDLFFVYNDKPREIHFEVNQDRLALASCRLGWNAFTFINNWPQHLPWKVENHDSDLTMMIILYGRDFDLSIVFNNRFRFAFYQIMERIPERIPSRAGVSVSYDILRVNIEPLPSTRLEMPTDKIRYILSLIFFHTIFKMGLPPRDFGVHVELAGYPGVKVFFRIIDPREGIDQE